MSLFKDLTELIERDGEHSVGIGENSDLWKGKLEVDAVPTMVAIKVLRGGSSSRPDFREQLIKVCFRIVPCGHFSEAMARIFADKDVSGWGCLILMLPNSMDSSIISACSLG